MTISLRAGLGWTALFAAIFIAMACFDHDVALRLGAMKTEQPQLIAPFQAVTTLGKSHWYLYPLGVYCLFAFAMMRRPGAARDIWRRRLQIAGFIFANVAVSGLAVDLFKIIIGRPRPVLLLEDGIFNQFAPFSIKSRWWSFPSGHSTTGMAVALAAGALWPRWRWALLAMAGVVAASRVIVTAHYISDTFAGIGMAALVFMLLTLLWRRRGWEVWAKGRDSGNIP